MPAHKVNPKLLISNLAYDAKIPLTEVNINTTIPLSAIDPPPPGAWLPFALGALSFDVVPVAVASNGFYRVMGKIVECDVMLAITPDVPMAVSFGQFNLITSGLPTPLVDYFLGFVNAYYGEGGEWRSMSPNQFTGNYDVWLFGATGVVKFDLGGFSAGLPSTFRLRFSYGVS